MSFKTHVALEVDSNKRTTGSIGSFNYHINRPITFNRRRQYFVRLEDIKLPITYYNINSTNNTFIIEEDNGVSQVDLSVSVPSGNYQPSELLTELQTLLNANTNQVNTYTLNKSDITGKVSIVFTGGSTQITVKALSYGSTLNTILGFDNTDRTTADSVILYSPNHVIFSPVRFLRIETDITSSNYYTKDSNKRIGAMVPITELRGNIQLYDNHDGPLYQFSNTHNITNIDFKVVDQDNNVIDFNGVDWSCLLVIYEWRGD